MPSPTHTPPALTPQEFVSRWKGMALTERASSQSHFIDLCAVLGQPTPTEVDQTGDTYTFEKGVTKSSKGGKAGGQGWADVWKRGCFAWEYKRKGGNLVSAYEQLQRYREALENPPLLVVSDIATIEIHTNFTNTVKQVYKLTLDDLLDSKKLDLLRRVFSEPETLRVNAKTTAEVTEQAAREFARLGEILRRKGVEPGQAAHFLIRLLFCLFAEDIGLLPSNLFSKIVESSKVRPYAVFEKRLGQLFEAMRTGGNFGAEDILYFNGGLFDDASVLDLGTEGLEILYRVSKLDWSAIEPAILGTLFERTLDPTKRAQLGAHYTSKADILLIVEPVLMAPLRRRWQDEIQPKARELAQKRDVTNNASQRTRLNSDLASLLTNFADEIAKVQVLDPACGSGNFLYVALKQLLDLQKEVVVLAGDLGLSRFFPTVSPQQLHGIEVNEYAHELAQATIWIGMIQWLRDNGFGQPDEPILKPINSILNIDAIMGYDEVGNPIEPQWPQADVIIGNPPFLGGNKIRQELGDNYVNSLFKLYEGRVPAFADLVCYWFERARQLIADGKLRRVGLLATNSIRGGVNRRVLERIKDTGDIFMAWSDRPWVLEGAAVRVSMVGFDDGSETEHYLDGKKVNIINPELTSQAQVSSAKILNEDANICFMGPSPKAPFDIDFEAARKMLDAPLNINNRSNSDVVRPVVSATDLVQHPRHKWTIDFGVMSLEQASEYELPFTYIKKVVLPIRSKNRRAAYVAKWWQYAEARPGMRKALSGKKRFIATPGVAKHRIFVWIAQEVLCNQGTLVYARDDDYFFGILQSKSHELWALHTGTSLGPTPRYTPTTTFETFPFPWPPGTEPKDDARVEVIAQAARELVEKRDNWLNPPGASEVELKKRTLTNLYNQRPTWLDLAHQKLDRAVFAAYGWPSDLSDEQILEKLLTLNLERAAKQMHPVGQVVTSTAISQDALDDVEDV